jgi:hypothetical protein
MAGFVEKGDGTLLLIHAERAVYLCLISALFLMARRRTERVYDKRALRMDLVKHRCQA